MRPDEEASRVRLKAGQRQVTDGPFTKKEAVEWAKKIPLREGGGYVDRALIRILLFMLPILYGMVNPISRMTYALKYIVALTVVWGVPTVGSPVGGLEDGRTGKIQFESSTPSDEFSVINGRHRPKVIVEGTLSLPKRAKPPYFVA